MFETLSPLETDAILTLMQAYRDDPRPDKIDLGVGIWREANGQTPVFKAVKRAEEALWHSQSTKAYTGLLGDPEFTHEVAGLLFGATPSGMAAAATVGGTSAVRQLLALSKTARSGTRVWIPEQSWPNHQALCDDLELEARRYAWLDQATGAIDRDAVLRDLSKATTGDIAILHACCHNPTGADADNDLQIAMLDLFERQGVIPLIDAAYLGFADTPEADTGLIRKAQNRLPEIMVAFSGSKSFGLYRERVGLAVVLSARPKVVSSHLAVLNRMDFTFPPDHGARCVSMILREPDLRDDWLSELAAIRESLKSARTRLASALRRNLQSERYDILEHQSGMFALLPLGDTRVAKLREEHGIYIVGQGRINLAGVTEATTDRVASALAQVLR